MINLIQTNLERGVSIRKIESTIHSFQFYPQPIVKKLINKVGQIVIQKKENFNFQNKLPKTIDTAEFSCIKQNLNGSINYLNISNSNSNILIFKDVENLNVSTYIFSSNGYFCLQLKTGERKYGYWKCVNSGSFECSFKTEHGNETLYFDKTANEIMNKLK